MTNKPSFAVQKANERIAAHIESWEQKKKMYDDAYSTLLALSLVRSQRMARGRDVTEVEGEINLLISTVELGGR